ncbi:MAG: excinuclease ABC subunit UvrC [Treponema sp.]|jgi:excinuclease ABC subunit C|nr:excinuclease ABC subunit UvrC [Treponema sp.]
MNADDSPAPPHLAALKEAARNAPLDPGVYLWRDEDGKIIYVGKAKALRRRLSSYFAGRKDPKTAALILRGRCIETIIVSNEYEALLLENTLIKQHSPRYNINLKDGKSYPVIRLSAEPFPRVFKTRRVIEDGSRYFGPFPNVQAVDRVIALVDRVFPLRKCRRFRVRQSPCLYFHMGRCLAPCCGRVSAEGYAERAAEVTALLECAGSGSVESAAPVIARLEARMRGAAEALRFEEAALYRNALAAVRELAAPNAVTGADEGALDCIAWADEGLLTVFAVLSTTTGRLSACSLYSARSAAPPPDTLATFLMTYYGPGRPPPPRIIIPNGIYAAEDMRGEVSPPAANGAGSPPLVEALHATPPRRPHPPAPFSAPPLSGGEQWPQSTKKAWSLRDAQTPDRKRASVSDAPATPPPLTSVDALSPITPPLHRRFREQFGYTPAFSGPEAHRDEALLAMARQNAAEELRRRLRERGAGPALDELREALSLKARPERIEGFDIAQLDGRHPVASLIAFRGGAPDRKNYRHFKLKTVVGIVDDFAAMREAVTRRYARVLSEGADPPDLILVDGGIGQVNAARAALDALGLDTPVAGLAKRDEEVWLPHAASPIRLSRRSDALKTLQFVRDETHRFATGLNQRLRSKDLGFQILESIDGIGKTRAAALMREAGSLAALARADPAALASRCQIPLPLARAVRAACRLALEKKPPAKRREATQAHAAAQAKALAEEALGE